MAHYREVKVKKDHIKVQKLGVNGHEFEVFAEYMLAAKEWYVSLVGVLPKYLESEHKKPMLLGRGGSEEAAMKAATELLTRTFPAWSADKMAAWKQRQVDLENEKKAAAEKAAAAKKAALAAAAKPAAPKPAAEGTAKAPPA